MRITPVSYNYTNQKVQRNNNQPNFGLIMEAKDLEPILAQVYSKGRNAFNILCDTLASKAKELGKLRHDGKQITVKVIKGTGNNMFKVEATCEGIPGFSDEFIGATDGTQDAGIHAADRLVTAIEQAAHNADPSKDNIISNKAREFAQRLKSSDGQFNPGS